MGETLADADAARLAVDHAADTVAVTDREGRIQYVNPAWEKVTGWSRADAIGRTPRILRSGAHPPDFYENLWKTVLAGDVFRTTFINRRRGGEMYPQEETIAPVRGPDGQITHFVSTGRDVSEKRRAEDEARRRDDLLREAQRMESVGRLAGGIAHDFNNMLTVIAGNVDLLRRANPASPEPALEDIARAASRAGVLVKRLLSYARKQVLQVEPIDLVDFLKGIETLIFRLAGPATEVRLETGEGAPVVRVDRSQFEQAVLNLVLNAGLAMPQGGRLTLRTGQATLTAVDAAAIPGLAPGAYATLTIADTGIGMPPEVLAHCFEPFFTTRSQGEGTGLGLAAVHGTISQLGGAIVAHSSPGQGATFRIFLPAATAPSQAEAARG